MITCTLIKFLSLCSLFGFLLYNLINELFVKFVKKMAEMKPEEFMYRPMDQLQGLEYCIDSNPTWCMLVFHFSL